MSKFKKGDRVKLNGSDVYGVLTNSDGGVIVGFRDKQRVVQVRWDRQHRNFHDCFGKCDKGHGWEVYKEELKLDDKHLVIDYVLSGKDNEKVKSNIKRRME